MTLKIEYKNRVKSEDFSYGKYGIPFAQSQIWIEILRFRVNALVCEQVNTHTC